MIGSVVMGRSIEMALGNLKADLREAVRADISRLLTGELLAVQLQCLTLQIIATAFQHLISLTAAERAALDQPISSKMN